MYSYIDMHCDTLLQTLHKGSSLLYENEGMQSLKLMHEAVYHNAYQCKNTYN